MKEHAHPQYISELNAFHRRLGTHCMSANAILMWFMLIGLVNAGGWEEWVQIDNLHLMHLIRTKTEKTALRARKELIDAGLLLYEKAGADSADGTDCGGFPAAMRTATADITA